ncbi:MAG TPA: RHS repeat-associated core domain-containing protein, partial [Niastella sp.]
DYVQRLKGSAQKIGTSIVLRVMSGDKVHIRASSWYRQNGVGPGSPQSALTDIVASLAEGLAGPAAGKALLPSPQVLSPGVASYLAHQGSQSPAPTKPKAYLSWLLLDEQLKPVITNDGKNSGFEQVGSDQEFRIHQVTGREMTKNGYLYIYLSNESPDIDVFFDNLQVTHTSGPMLEETHYYPFGLTMAGISPKAIMPNKAENKYKYNGYVLTNDFDINLYETFYRSHDPQIGRFWQIDPKVEGTESWSPYTSMLNNPIRFADPLGDSAITSGDIESINEYLRMLGERTGNTYALNKKGQIIRTNKELNKKSSGKVSATLSSLVETIITDEKKHIELNFTAAGDAANLTILVDDYISATIDVSDMKKIESNEFQAALLGHALAEQYSAPQNETRSRSNYDVPHEVGKVVESVIISEMTGTPYGGRVESKPDKGYWNTKVEFRYNQKVYQITTKTNGIIFLEGPTGRMVDAKKIK